MLRFFISFLLIGFSVHAQTNKYQVSFDNAVHHEAKIQVHFTEVPSGDFKVRMSRTSPGRYAIHEFAKNVYGFKATDETGKELAVRREDPYSWIITDHKGTVNIEYLLFANRGDGTYSQVDETHAHLNIPATFMYAETLKERPIEVDFDIREDLNWKVATQLEKVSETKFRAPNMYYFMDSPVEISDYMLKEFDVEGQNVRFVLHHLGTEEEFSEYFEKAKAIVLQEKAVYGELPTYDFGEYTFLGCYMPNASGDGMEHRNSTIVSSSRSLAEGGMENNIGTVAHEFFHCWNVERIRPEGLEPFDFTEANMSGALWFAEGFTSYYTGLILTRANIWTHEKYIESLAGTFNYVWNSPARDYFNPIEMSYQAPFVDAATSVDPVNRENTFISYYSYGSVLGLALDLSLRGNKLNLDDFMKLMWIKFGKTENPYSLENIENTLAEYAGKEFAENFFSNYIYASKMPDYKKLFAEVGVKLFQEEKTSLGASFRNLENGVQINRNTYRGRPAYNAGLDNNDIITSVNGKEVGTLEEFSDMIAGMEKGSKINVEFLRGDTKMQTEVRLGASEDYTIKLDEKADKQAVANRENWLKIK
ncbi:PDZ domain-containing protein [Gramella sp. AN32]|uniref:M61 family metallopeptidase n=1 Tax=Christiangramia antarctica TaxID=2058158 RepID=A0ABW5X0J6_9FLAO|nr:PDZ domain-containing protein [Gramella sp. AN32]MCM4155230.1 peptidase M61 [Gramella sp. AN32]